MEALDVILSANSNGIRSLYIGRGTGWNNRFNDTTIEWEADQAAMTFANATALKLEEKKLIIVDSNRLLMGFYFLPNLFKNNIVTLDLFYRIGTNNKYPPAPGRVPGFAMGTNLDQESLEDYILKLKEFKRQ